MSEAIPPREVDWTDFLDLKKDMTDMKSLMARMVDALGRIAVIEDRQQSMAQSTAKVLDRIELIAEKQHQYELTNVTNVSNSIRIDRNESDIKLLAKEQVEANASFKTAVWISRALWAGIASIGGLVWLLQALAHAPIPVK